MNDGFPLRTGLGCAFGKVILLGEHAVVHGYPAAAVGLERGLEASTSASQGPLSVAAESWKLRASVRDDSDHGRALAAMLRTAGLPEENVTVKLCAHIPARAGLGASAAMSVAVLRSLADFFDRPLSDERLFQAAQASEKVFHQNPSGLDAAMAIHGGAARFTRAEGISQIPTSTRLNLLVVHSGAPKDTARSVARFAARMAESPKEAGRRLARIGDIAEQGIRALATGDDRALGALMTENHDHLKWFDVSTEALDRLVEIALKGGAVGAKLTGGGGGGCAVVLLPSEVDGEGVVRALDAAGFHRVNL